MCFLCKDFNKGGNIAILSWLFKWVQTIYCLGQLDTQYVGVWAHTPLGISIGARTHSHLDLKTHSLYVWISLVLNSRKVHFSQLEIDSTFCLASFGFSHLVSVECRLVKVLLPPPKMGTNFKAIHSCSLFSASRRCKHEFTHVECLHRNPLQSMLNFQKSDCMFMWSACKEWALSE